MNNIETRLRAYVASMVFELRRSNKKLPILNFQFHQLVKCVASETKLDVGLVTTNLANLLSYSIHDCDVKILTLLNECDLDKVFAI